MSEYRVHWVEDGWVRYSWHPTKVKAVRAADETRRRLSVSFDDINDVDNIVEFNLSYSTKTRIIDFLNEHCPGGPQCTTQ